MYSSIFSVCLCLLATIFCCAVPTPPQTRALFERRRAINWKGWAYDIPRREIITVSTSIFCTLFPIQPFTKWPLLLQETEFPSFYHYVAKLQTTNHFALIALFDGQNGPRPKHLNFIHCFTYCCKKCSAPLCVPSFKTFGRGAYWIYVLLCVFIIYLCYCVF